MFSAHTRAATHSDVLERIGKHYTDLSPTFKRIVDLVVQHQDEAPFLTAAQLAERAGVSESSVVRLAQTLGFSGYPDLRRAMQSDFRARASHGAMMISGRAGLQSQPTAISEIARGDAALIRDTAARLDPAVLDRCVDRILAAREVYVVGHRASYAVAEYLATTLRQGIGIGLPLSFGSGMAFDIIASADPSAVLIAISITPYFQQTIDLLCAAKYQGLGRIVLTDHSWGAPAQLADEVLIFETEIHAFTSSYIAAFSIIHMLLAQIRQRAQSRVERYLMHSEPLFEAFRTRYHEGDELPSLPGPANPEFP